MKEETIAIIKMVEKDYDCSLFLGDNGEQRVCIYKHPFYFEVTVEDSVVTFVIEKDQTEILYCEDFDPQYLPIFLQLC